MEQIVGQSAEVATVDGSSVRSNLNDLILNRRGCSHSMLGGFNRGM